MSYQWIKASEIGDYVYCRRAWWLKRVQGNKPENVRELKAGTRHHQQHGRLVQRAIWTRRAAYVVLFCVVTVVFFQIITTWIL
ncbi:MAG: hypothetical protein AAF614_20960 [Chloroflexota bacterium]